MDAEDFEFEERAITKAVGLSFHRLDLGVGAFQRSGGDRVVVIGQDAFLVGFQGVRELGQHADTGGTGTSEGHEGVMAKHLTSTYRPGRRSMVWRRFATPPCRHSTAGSVVCTCFWAVAVMSPHNHVIL